MPLTPEQANEIEFYRRKDADGTATIEDYQKALLIMRNHRLSAISAPRATKGAKKPTQSVADMEAELGLL